jgi:hypothetical protein
MHCLLRSFPVRTERMYRNDMVLNWLVRPIFSATAVGFLVAAAVSAFV